MFEPHIYRQRRDTLCRAMGSGILLFVGHEAVAVNAPDHVVPFRQDSSFLYYFGHNVPGLVGIMDAGSGKHLLFGPNPDPEAFIWTGPQPSIQDLALAAGADEGLDIAVLPGHLNALMQHHAVVHFLPPYRPDTRIVLGHLLDLPLESLDERASCDLTRAVIAQRSVKSDLEIAEIEAALDISSAMYARVFAYACPGRTEQEVKAALEGEVLARGSRTSFASIVTTRGNVLHNHNANRTLAAGDLLLIDSGAESPNGYASDITRTFPVGGEFSPLQKDLYAIVLEAQKRAIDALGPGGMFVHAHMEAARAIVQGLKDMGVMQGNTDDAVREGAHALFFVHGIGHMLGLDCHDMESLGEDLVGYDATIARSTQFGLRSLRLARKVQPGFVATVEPGIYVIPELIASWRSQNRCASFIRYDAIERLNGFTGIRIEDDVVVEQGGARVLGTPIPKELWQMEQIGG
ncbi:aminopeptidase P family protein [Desulfoplanes formicivorans]|uniref:Xaa-Pro aminopeptidase n=1 Tax=Desulfoplanes formicivorans TaxID=1592317 RepID=A0A194AGY1_9BACT|nr:aminopeptidase P family protein [Desulfoplanes formicivorans]GAU09337.1 Xaa-Pro aminopeptidase [Desulfoplanes formicivorans]